FEQFRRSEQAANIVAGAQNRYRLLDYVGFVLIQSFGLTPLDQLDHPARIKVDAKANAAAILAKVFDSKTQPARPRWSKHQPVSTPRKIFIRQRVAEHFIVDAKVFDLEPALGDAGRPSGFEGENWLALESLRQPASDGAAAQPLIFERRKLSKVAKRVDLFSRIPTELRCEVEPERTSGLGVEMPGDDLAHVSVELGPCFLCSERKVFYGNTHLVISLGCSVGYQVCAL